MIWTTGHEEWGPILLYGAIFFCALSIGCFFWPLFKKLAPSWNYWPRTRWNKAPPSQDATPSSVYLTPYEACHYISAESQWGAVKAAEITPDGMRKNVLLEAPGEFQERAAEGKVRVYGAPENKGAHELIDKTFWMSGGLHHSCAFNQTASRTDATTFQAGFSGIETYHDLKIEAGDVYKTWPRR